MKQEYNIHEAAQELVDRECPASALDERKRLAKKLIAISIREDEPIERAWAIESYWD